MGRALALGATLGLGFGLALACNGGPRDATEHTTDVRVDASATDGTYGYVAKRARIAIGLAEARSVSDGDAKDVVDHLADSASGCLGELERQGKLVDGALRMVLAFDGGGIGQAPQVVFAPGPAVAANGLLCIVAPARMLALAPAEAGAPVRAIALEIAWGASVGGGP